jgi:hypothetical protein
MNEDDTTPWGAVQGEARHGRARCPAAVEVPGEIEKRAVVRPEAGRPPSDRQLQDGA